jgi:isopenicillin N synthase-like dioxygenase
MNTEAADVAHILDEFRRVGYSQLAISASLAARLISMASTFYAKPLSERMAIGAFKTRSVLGYYPSEAEAKAFAEQSGDRIPLFEGHRARGYCSFDYLMNEEVLATCELFKANQWPPGDIEFCREASELYKILSTLMKHLSQSILDELRNSANAHCTWTDFSGPNCCSLMRVLKYGKYGKEMKSKPHTDYEFVSFIYSNIQGLQVKSPSDDWITVSCDPSQAIILPGDMLEVATDGNIKSIQHRVRFGLDERMAVIFFQGLEFGQRIDYPSFCRELPPDIWPTSVRDACPRGCSSLIGPSFLGGQSRFSDP